MTNHLAKWREENPQAAEEQARKSQEALKACWDCSNFQREEILHCPVKTCRLWYVRPYQKKGKDFEDDVETL